MDYDQDGTPDRLDLDTDNDGILDRVEGVPAWRDAAVISAPTDQKDSDGDGIVDIIEGDTDVDNDGVPNYLDLDRSFLLLDGDGIPDKNETAADGPDKDGIPNFLDLDSDADGITDFVEGAGDQDGDGIPNYLDLDSDGDGILDSHECQCTVTKGLNYSRNPQDFDADGIPNYLDLDSDNDGILDEVEGEADSNGNGQPDYLDPVTSIKGRSAVLDADGDGIPDSVEGTGDFDQGETNFPVHGTETANDRRNTKLSRPR
eukprot:762521-Hanusia_phi.AAC.42